MRLEQRIVVLISAVILTLFIPSCARYRHVPVPTSLDPVYDMKPWGKRDHLLYLPPGRELSQLIKELGCGTQVDRCEVGDGGRLIIINMHGEAYIIQEEIPGAHSPLMEAAGCRRYFICATDGKTITIQKRR